MQPSRLFRLIYSGCMSLCMVSLMSVWITFINLGWSGLSWQRWGHAVITAWPVAWMMVFLLAPRIQRFVTALMGHLGHSK